MDFPYGKFLLLPVGGTVINSVITGLIVRAFAQTEPDRIGLVAAGVTCVTVGTYTIGLTINAIREIRLAEIKQGEPPKPRVEAPAGYKGLYLQTAEMIEPIQPINARREYWLPVEGGGVSFNLTPSELAEIRHRIARQQYTVPINPLCAKGKPFARYGQYSIGQFREKLVGRGLAERIGGNEVILTDAGVRGFLNAR